MGILYRLDAAHFDRVVHDVDPHGTVLAQEDAVVDADMRGVGPAAIKAVLIILFL